MNLLVLGGTSFVGRHLVFAARAAGIEVTLFNRGQTNAGLFSDLEQLRGDRDGGLDALQGRRWDAVLDVNGYLPRIVAQSVDVLRNTCEHYTYISTVSVYGTTGSTGPSEQTPVATLDEDTEEITGATYGPLKAQCEAVVLEGFPDALIVRPGVVVGAYDPTERFVRWVRRGADGGEILAPGEPDGVTQFIDARDLADWTIQQLLAGASGTFNANRPPLPMSELLQTCVDVAGTDATLTWVPADFLEAQGVRPWADLPLFLPAQLRGALQADVTRAVAAGLRFRPLADTVRATLHWDRTRSDAGPAGLALDREREVLAAWHARQA